MKNQALFSSKDMSKKLKCRLLQFLFGALRVKIDPHWEGKKNNNDSCSPEIVGIRLKFQIIICN